MNLIFSDMKQKALQIFLAGVDNVLPNKLVNKVFSRKDFQLDKFNNIYLLAFGKASFLMAKEAENILGERIVDGVVITTYGNGGKLDKLKVIEAGHPIPDDNGLDRKSTRLNSSHVRISYAVFCLKKKNNIIGWACTHLFRYFSILVSPASSPTFSIRALLVLTPFARLLFLSCSQYLSRCLSQCLR